MHSELKINHNHQYCELKVDKLSANSMIVPKAKASVQTNNASTITKAACRTRRQNTRQCTYLIQYKQRITLDANNTRNVSEVQLNELMKLELPE